MTVDSSEKSSQSLREIFISRFGDDDRDEEIVVYRCTECGKTSVSIGWLHAHVERHRGFFGLQLPWRVGDFDALMEMTEVLRVEDYSEVDIERGGSR